MTSGAGLRGVSPRTNSLTFRAGLKLWAQKHVDNAAYCLKHKINVGVPLPT